MILGETPRSCLLASSIYQKRITPKKIWKVNDRKIYITEEKEYLVRMPVTENPPIITREISRPHDFSQTSAVKIPHKH